MPIVIAQATFYHAKFLLSLGFPKVAQIVGANMDLIPGPKLDKTQNKVCHEHRASSANF